MDDRAHLKHRRPTSLAVNGQESLPRLSGGDASFRTSSESSPHDRLGDDVQSKTMCAPPNLCYIFGSTSGTDRTAQNWRRLLMDDVAYGKRNKRGDWAPSATLTIAAGLRASTSASRFSEMAPRLFSALEPPLRRVCGRLCAFRPPGRRSHEAVGLGLDPHALHCQLRGGCCCSTAPSNTAFTCRGLKETASSTTPNFPMTRRTTPSCSGARTSKGSSGDLEPACRSGRPTRSGSSSPSLMVTRHGSRSPGIRSISDA